ncbi:hypothetical protein OVY01_15315 [Robbsia sp. Bb-Pol-6]|uniref:Uncharacterized protein n=1 Tax=Robbsia betulipollinis TaxID=2981849 RepID=A0ABT3ZPS8_9BURK|nr:hypothetical protein [Robbsia betulipollinis]MCY0388554.1 hypothetical protein [Robbsia betulipollinis]
MEYRLNASAARAALAAFFVAVGTLAWASLAAVHADDGWRLPALLGAALAFLAVCAYDWRAAAGRQPRAIRLMGGQCAILYYSRPRGGPAALRAVDVTIERVVHWPGRLAGMRFVPVPANPRARGAPAREVLIFADALPASRFHSLGIHLRCIARGVTLVEYR